MKKRVLSILLIIVFAVALFGCDSAEPAAQAATGFRVGYGKVDITPKNAVPLRGYGNTSNRMSTGYLDRIYATCVAITDEHNETVLLYGTDLTVSDDLMTDMIRASVEQKTGVPVDKIHMSASHSHSAPDVSNEEIPAQAKYNRQLVEWMTEAAQLAMDDRKPAQMYMGSVEILGQSFVRHYVLADGTSVGYESMVGDGDAVDHAGQGDYTMQLLKFVREGGKDVLMTNWQVHPHRTGAATRYDVSSDIIGVMRAELETQLDCHVAYYQGAAGNMNPTSMVASETVAEDYRQQGKQIAQVVINGGDEIFVQVQTGAVQTLQITYEARIDHSCDHLLAKAMEVSQIWSSTNNRAQADAVGIPFGIRSPYHANKIVSMAKQKQTGNLELNAVSVGDVAFITAGYEMFASEGMYIKEHSPYKMTFVLGYANEAKGYIPATAAFDYLGYEVDITHYEQGTAELLAQQYVDMLEQLMK